MSGTIRVVAVEADAAAARETAAGLEDADGRLDVSPAAGLEAVLELLDGTAFDGVVASAALAPEDGLAVLRAVRQRYPALPTVLYTADGPDSLASQVVDAGVTSYLPAAGDDPAALADGILDAVQRSRESARAAQLRALSDAFPDTVFHIDPDGRFLDVLTGSSNLVFPQEPSDIVGSRFHDLHPTAQADRFLETVERALETGETQTLEYHFDRADVDRWFEARVVPLEPSASTARSVLWAARDVTERKERQRVLEQYRSLVDAMEDPACIYDADGRYAVVNRHLAEGYGTTPDDLRGRESQLVDHVRELGDGDPFQALLDGELGELQGEYESPIAGRGTVEFRLTPLVIDGERAGVVAVSRDVTGRKARERELERTNARLEEFASIVSHDLRNPLNVAAGRLELARADRDSDDLEEVAVALGRMEALIEDLLTLAREGARAGELGPVPLDEIAGACWRNVRTADAALVTETDRTVRADRGSLRQLLENLFRNAVEHGDDDVTVRVGDLDDGFFVEDDGPGFPDGDPERPFERGHSTSASGTGFGLSIVRGIAEAHGWSVRATEAPGGARLEVTGVESG